jgi:uncharacterized membrane protein
MIKDTESLRTLMGISLGILMLATAISLLKLTLYGSDTAVENLKYFIAPLSLIVLSLSTSMYCKKHDEPNKLLGWDKRKSINSLSKE